MNVWHEIITVIRGLANEVGEKITDSFALNQLESNTYAARKHLEEAQQHLRSIVATQRKLKQNILYIQANIQKLETHAKAELQERNQQKAYALAERIAQLSNKLESQKSLCQSYTQQIREFKLSMYQAEQNIKTMRRESLALRATESIQKARSLSQRKFSSRQSLQRIRHRQQQRKDYFRAHSQVQNPEKEQKLIEKDGRVELVEVFFDDLDYKESLLDKVEKTQTQAMHEAMSRVLDQPRK